MFTAASPGVPSFGDLSYKAPVAAVFAAALPACTRTGNVLTANANGALPAADGIALVLGSRVLVFLQGASSGSVADNGIYTVTALGSGAAKWSLTRAADCDTAAEAVPGATVSVLGGTINFRQVFVASGNPWTLNVTDPDFRPVGAPYSSNATRLRKPWDGSVVAPWGVSIEGAGAVPGLSLLGIGDVNIAAGLRAGALVLGAGGATALDLRLYRSAAKTATLDDNGGGALTLLDLLGAPINGKAPVVNVYVAGATWVKPANLLYVTVECVGGGGQAGGGAATVAGSASAPGGGGGGGTARKLLLASAIGSNGTVVVGAGGSTGGVGANGQAGGLSSFAATGIVTVQGNGGGGGAAPGTSTGTGPLGAPGNGGTATGGDTNDTGGDGGVGVVSAGAIVGNGFGGGSSHGGVTRGPVSGNGAGTVGSQYGGGGSASTTSGAAGVSRAGAAGAGGVVIVTEYYGP